MEQLSIELPTDHAKFLSEFARRQGITVSETVDRIISFLQRAETQPADSNVLSLIGSLKKQPSMWDYLTHKYE